ncbi:hypothetical protein [Arundinibacter roseus]|uniref:Uncharacterized protein n=1 Tax=Arundinibacter roseus TaxID=2070510 RepID=A0A4R4KM72_9BACT|nr:hypothetical protein [Arundinibacter roseus]TDB69083.1 hypothetical protein EZE20_01745 [Arundinibacter roseus]
MIRGRQQYGQKQRKPLTDEKRQQMINESRACMVVQFHNNPKQMKMWSKCNQRKHRNIGDAINYLMWLVNEYKNWKGCVCSAAIFDTRATKNTGAENKIYQFERGHWVLESSNISW